MRVKVLAAVALFAAIATVNAATYNVYKGTEKYSVYKDGTKKSGKPDKMTIKTYVVINDASFDSNYDEDENPQRIVLITGKDAKGLEDASGAAKAAKKFFIDPTALSSYVGDETYNTYKVWAGPWLANIYRVNGSDIISQFLEFDGTTALAEVGETYAGNKAKTLKGSALINTAAITSEGALSSIEVKISSKSTLKYDKKLTAETSGSADMDEAVQAVTAYLVEKKYSSTWK